MYCEGKMQRTLKRELKVLEIVKREPIITSIINWVVNQWIKKINVEVKRDSL